MKKIFYSICINLFCLNGFGQVPDTAINSISYLFLHQRDTTSPSYYTEEMTLMFGRSSSVYISSSKSFSDSLIRANVEQQLRDGQTLQLGMLSRNYTRQNYYQFFRNHLVKIESPFLSNTFIFDDTIPKIHWKVLEEFRIIGNYKCQKATGFFAGRQYEAWFCPEFALNAGPWKLCGLPGLIFEANDSRNQVKFVFNAISKMNGGLNTIAPSLLAIKTNRIDFKKMIKAYNVNPFAFANTSGLDIKVNKKLGPSMKSTINNPLEISDKIKIE